MLGTHQSGRRRRVALAGVCLGLALVTAAPVAAYPITPDGEPLHLESPAPTSSMPPEGIASPNGVGATTQPSTANDPLPATDFASNGTDWSGAISIAAVSALAALALIAVAFALTGRRRRSAGAH
jgi:hypothetical protein